MSGAMLVDGINFVVLEILLFDERVENFDESLLDPLRDQSTRLRRDRSLEREGGELAERRRRK